MKTQLCLFSLETLVTNRGGGLPSLGVLGPSIGSGGTSNGIGPEFGTSMFVFIHSIMSMLCPHQLIRLVFAGFPSPNPEDYNETIDIEKETKKEEETEETTVSEGSSKEGRGGKAALDACCLPVSVMQIKIAPRPASNQGRSIEWRFAKMNA